MFPGLPSEGVSANSAYGAHSGSALVALRVQALQPARQRAERYAESYGAWTAPAEADERRT